MITVSIGGVGVPLDSATPQWVSEMLREAGKGNALVCVRVDIDFPGARMRLGTPACSGNAGTSRPLTELERQALAAWRERGLQDGRVSQGQVVAFLQELGRLF